MAHGVVLFGRARAASPAASRLQLNRASPRANSSVSILVLLPLWPLLVLDWRGVEIRLDLGLVSSRGVSGIQSIFSTLVEPLLSSFNSMEMEINQVSESGIQQKPGPEINQNPVEHDVNPEKETDEMPGSEVNQEPVVACQDTVVETDINPEKQIADPGGIYRCKRCRQMVATREFVVTHKVGRGEESFKTRKRFHVDDDDKKPECMCIFVEPMKWMQAVEEGYVSQKLYCMGCKALLGQFNWAGMQCTCGTWVIPAFQLTKSKIDECSM